MAVMFQPCGKPLRSLFDGEVTIQLRGLPRIERGIQN